MRGVWKLSETFGSKRVEGPRRIGSVSGGAQKVMRATPQLSTRHADGGPGPEVLEGQRESVKAKEDGGKADVSHSARLRQNRAATLGWQWRRCQWP
jgi:hypothetical protein